MNLKRKILEKIRDKALVLIGFSGGFRRSELVDIEYEDIEFVEEGVKIFVKRSKTDQFGEGMTKAIPYFDNINFCPVKALNKWTFIVEAEIKEGKIFNISDKSVALIIKKYANYAGLDSHRYAGHSLRSGFRNIYS
jgi:site-specific recombinase XerD